MKESKIDIQSKLIDEGRNFKAPDLAKTILKLNQEVDLAKLVFSDDVLLSNRAMWVLWHCSNIDYGKIKPFHVKLIRHLENKKIPSGVVRCILGLFQKHSPPIEQHSFLLDKCYNYIMNPSEAIAVRAFAITVVFNISKPYLELLQELEIVLQHLAPTESGSGMKTRIKNTLQATHKLILSQK
jgi:hypothetical protein